MNLRSILTIALLVMAPTAPAQESAPALAPGNRALSIELPERAFTHEGAALSVDLDGYDVSPFSRVDGTMLEINLEVPLSPGRHVLSVLLFLPDGHAEVLLNETLHAPEIEGGHVSLNTTMQTSYRADQRPDATFESMDRATSTGSLSMEGENTSGRWRLASGIDAIYDRYNNANPDESWLLPSYSLSATYLGDLAETSAAAGNIDVAREDFLFSSFKRRGAALQTEANSGRFKLQAFSVASLRRNSFDGDYLAPGDSNDRTRGISAAFDLVQDHLQIRGSFIDGKTAYGGAGFSIQDDAVIYGGESWNVAVDSRWLNGSIWLNFEHAASEFDIDGIGVGLPAQKDDATQARLRLSSMGRLGSGPFSHWSADFVHKRVGRDFYSVGNLLQPGNLEINSAKLQGGFESLVLGVELSRERTNPDDDPWIAKQTFKRAGINVSYSPAMLDPDYRLWKAIGTPALSGWIFRSDSSQPKDHALLAGFDLDNTTDEVGLALTFARETLTWSVELGVVDYEDSSEAVVEGGYLLYEPLSDSRNVQASIQASWAPSARVTLDAHLQHNNLEETDYDDKYRSTSYGLSGLFFLAPERLSLHVSAGRDQERRRFGGPLEWTERIRSRFAGTQLNWLVTPPEGRNPRFSLYLKGAYARNEDLAFLIADEIWSVYVGAELSWAGGRP